VLVNAWLGIGVVASKPSSFSRTSKYLVPWEKIAGIIKFCPGRDKVCWRAGEIGDLGGRAGCDAGGMGLIGRVLECSSPKPIHPYVPSAEIRE